MGIFTRMTIANANNVLDPTVTMGNKKMLAAAINTTAALIEEGAHVEEAAKHSIEQLLSGFHHILEGASSSEHHVSKEYAGLTRESIEYFSQFLES